MTSPRTTPNPGTTRNPEQSSRRVARKKPLAWLPWALLAALAALLALVFLVINAIDDDGPDGPAGDSLGQVSGSDGSGLDGADGNGKIAGTEGGAPARQSTPAAPAPAAPAPAAPAPAGPTGGIAGLNAGALVGGAGIAATPASAVAATDAKRTPGTAGTVLFATGSASLDMNAQQVVAKAVENLRTAGAKTVEVRGYTDMVAGQQVNDPLSKQRADAVAAALRSQLPGVTVNPVALGQNDPVAPNDTDEGRQQNRRAAIVATN